MLTTTRVRYNQIYDIATNKGKFIFLSKIYVKFKIFTTNLQYV